MNPPAHPPEPNLKRFRQTCSNTKTRLYQTGMGEEGVDLADFSGLLSAKLAYRYQPQATPGCVILNLPQLMNIF